MKKALVAAAVIAATASFSAPAFAATGADSFSDVPKDHWAYEALDYLAKEGVVDGYTDGTFEGNRTMSRYEMAAIVYKACQNENISIGGRAVLDKLRAEYDAEIKQLNTRVSKVEKDVEELKKFGVSGFFRIKYNVDGNAYWGNNEQKHFYSEIQSKYKVNDNWTVGFQNEVNASYAARGGNKEVRYTDGVQRLWVDGRADNGNWVNIGRAWRGLGFQNMFYGNSGDGIMAGIKLNSNGLEAKPFYITRESKTYSMSNYLTYINAVASGTGMSPAEWANKQPEAASMYGLSIAGPIGHNFDIAATYAKASSKDTDANGNAWGLAAATNVAKNLRFVADYINVGNDSNKNGAAWGLRLNYKGINLQDKGSFASYLRYVKTGEIFGVMDQADDEWNTYERGSRTWVLGFQYVPAKNIEWHTMFGHGSRSYDTAASTRNYFRTQVDFHF